MWLRRRSERLLLWFAISTACPARWNVVYSFGIPISALPVEVTNSID